MSTSPLSVAIFVVKRSQEINDNVSKRQADEDDLNYQQEAIHLLE